MEKRKNDAQDTDYTRTAHIKSIVILGLLTFGVSTITFFLYNGLNSWAWVLYVAAFVSGWSIARIVYVFLLNPSNEPSTPIIILGLLVGALIGMTLGQFLRFRLVDIPNISALRHEAFDVPLDIYLSTIFSPLQSSVIQLYFVLLGVGSFIGIVGLEWLEHPEQDKKKDTQ